MTKALFTLLIPKIDREMQLGRVKLYLGAGGGYPIVKAPYTRILHEVQ
jgi:hypothetical protein